MFSDLSIILVSILVAVILVKAHVITRLLDGIENLEWLGSFVAGLFFTSVFTTAPAIVALGEIARANSLWTTALFGAAGAVIGDMFIFSFMRDRFSEHLMELLKHEGMGKRFRAVFRLRSFKWLTFLLAGLIIASPLPDEIGISLLGFSKMKLSRFLVLSFVVNTIGILLIGFAARAL